MIVGPAFRSDVVFLGRGFSCSRRNLDKLRHDAQRTPQLDNQTALAADSHECDESATAALCSIPFLVKAHFHPFLIVFVWTAKR